jgi:hypothetical protein
MARRVLKRLVEGYDEPTVTSAYGWADRGSRRQHGPNQ